MKFLRLENNANEITRMSAIASSIWKEHYDAILGSEQNDYMIEMFQSEKAISEQLKHDYEYYFVRLDDEDIGFIALYGRENDLYLSKFYLKKDTRRKGYSKKMLAFVVSRAKELGLPAIVLNVNKYNDALFAYEKLGLRKIGDEKIDIGNGYYMDDYVMEYRI